MALEVFINALRPRVLQPLCAARSTAAKARQMNRHVALTLLTERLQGDLKQIESRLAAWPRFC